MGKIKYPLFFQEVLMAERDHHREVGFTLGIKTEQNPVEGITVQDPGNIQESYEVIREAFLSLPQKYLEVLLLSEVYGLKKSPFLLEQARQRVNERVAQNLDVNPNRISINYSSQEIREMMLDAYNPSSSTSDTFAGSTEIEHPLEQEPPMRHGKFRSKAYRSGHQDYHLKSRDYRNGNGPNGAKRQHLGHIRSIVPVDVIVWYLLNEVRRQTDGLYEPEVASVKGAIADCDSRYSFRELLLLATKKDFSRGTNRVEKPPTLQQRYQQAEKAYRRMQEHLQPLPNDLEAELLEQAAQQGHWARRDRTPKYF